MKTATTIKVRLEAVEAVDCPYCGFELDGLIGDPRGSEIECDNCGNTFDVDPDADFESYSG